jgi:hypothetical protein
MKLCRSRIGQALLAGMSLLVMAASPQASHAGTRVIIGSSFFFDDGPVTIWVTIRARPGEEAWEACRRIYQRDVYQVMPLRDGRVRCRIDHSRIYDPGNVRRNFNR